MTGYDFFNLIMWIFFSDMTILQIKSFLFYWRNKMKQLKLISSLALESGCGADDKKASNIKYEHVKQTQEQMR